MILLAYPLELLLAALVALGFALLHSGQSKGFVSWAANLLGKVPLIAGFSIDQVIKLDRFVAHELGKAYTAVVGGAVRWFGALVHYVDVVGYWSLFWPIEVFHLANRLVHVIIPAQVQARTRPIARTAAQAEAQAKAAAELAHTLPKVAKGNSHVQEITTIQRVAMPHAGEWDWVHRHFKGLRRAVTAAAAGAIGLALPGHVHLPIPFGQTITQIRKRLRRLEGLLGVTGMAVAMAGVLGLGTNWRCLTRGNIGRVSRALCGLSAHAIGDLLGLLADVIIVADVCEVITLLNEGLTVIEGPLADLTSVAGAALCHGDYKAPATMPAVTLSLPPNPALVLSGV